MNVSARSSAAVLLGLTITLAAPAASALASHITPSDPGAACDNAVPSTTNPHCITVGGSVVPNTTTTTADGGVLGEGVRRADTGAGGSSSSGSTNTVLLVGGGLLLLGTAVGVRRASRGGKA